MVGNRIEDVSLKNNFFFSGTNQILSRYFGINVHLWKYISFFFFVRWGFVRGERAILLPQLHCIVDLESISSFHPFNETLVVITAGTT